MVLDCIHLTVVDLSAEVVKWAPLINGTASIIVLCMDFLA